ncbi:MAG: cbb3-type cytochrome oxidase assembly protein CcoS [Phycisphaerales bacterium]|nr:cbb3-type cytochrome oxidase assembly protein CcoS [Phycisphaerales bacterium]MCB9836873.1 cbb3-type cytochrome oxidase assembly protein CcoS [Phycisphaera sp.]
MSVLWIVIPLAFVFAGLAIAAFMWTVRTGQMDDLDTPASRILFEDDDTKAAKRTSAEKK